MNERSELFSGLEEGAIAHHEMYLSWLKAGFTEEQAMDLLKVVVGELLRRVASD